MWDLGDTVPLAVTVRDAAGDPANAASIALVVTLPDQTVDNLVVTNPPAQTGLYGYDYVPALVGMYRVAWAATSPIAAYRDVFHVTDGGVSFIGLAEAKRHLNMPAATTTHDEELRDFIASACEVAEDIVGVVSRRTFTETYSGRGDRAILLRRRPVVSVVSVTVDGTVVTDWSVTEHGVLTRTAGSWPRGVDNVVAVYVAGRAQVPAAVLDGTRELIRINWRPQQGGNFGVFNSSTSRPGESPPAGEVRLGFFIPNTVMQRFHPSARGPHVA